MMKIHNRHSFGAWVLFAAFLDFPRMVFAVEKLPLPATPTPFIGVSQGVSSGSLAQVTFGLLLVLALIIGIAWLLRRYGRLQSAASGSLKILGGLSIGARERVVLVQVGDTQLLVGVAPGRVQTLHVLDEPLVTPETNPAPGISSSISSNDLKGFAERLSAAIKQRKHT